jgi:hypothetical protein
MRHRLCAKNGALLDLVLFELAPQAGAADGENLISARVAPSEVVDWLDPTGRTSPSGKALKTLICNVVGISPSSLRKNVPPWASSKRSFLYAVAP